MALGCSFTVIGAQAPQTTNGEKLTVTGCLQRAQRNGSVGGTVVGTSASPNTADDEANSGALVNAFLLTDATVGTASGTTSGGNAAGSSAPASSTATPAATGTAGRAEPTTFGLQGQEAELERHQGARVEVTGTVIPPATSGRGTGGAATASGAKRLKVESYKVVAEKCTAP
jgi:hypothetical protein